MIQLFAATTNPGKLKEVKLIFGGSGIEILSCKDFPNISPVEEDRDTFKENAILKAQYFFEKTGIPSLGDDGGLMVDALGGAPGIRSHRWLGDDATDLELAQGILDRLKGLPKEKRTAQLGSCVAFVAKSSKNDDCPNNSPAIVLGEDNILFTACNFVKGYIVEESPKDIGEGFPYRAIFFIPQFGKLYQDLTHEEHERINHRRKSLNELKQKIFAHLKLL